MTEEEKMLLEQLQNNSITQHTNYLPSYDQVQNSRSPPNETPPKFTVPSIPSPLSSRRYEEDNLSVENVHLSVDSKKNIKLSSDSGLGSSELGEEHHSWKNGKGAIL